MSKVLRATGVLAAAGLAVPLWAVPSAFAAASTEPGATGAYYYSAGVDKPEESPTQPPNLTGDRTDGVAPEHLAVAVRLPDQIDKKSFLSFDLATVPVDATITRAVVSLPLAPDGEGNFSMSPAAAKVRACAAGDEGFNGEDCASFAQAPTDKCDLFAAPGRDSADKTSYEFDISTLAASWLTGANDGLALTVAEGAGASPFQVVFQPFAKASIALTFTLPPADTKTVAPLEVPTGSEPVDDPTGTAASGDAAGDAGSFDSGSLDSGSFDSGPVDVGSAPAPEFGVAGAPIVGSEPAPSGDVAAAPAPQTAGAPVSTTPVASSRPSEVLDPTASAWLGGLLFAALLALLSLIMGDSRVAATVVSQTRLARTLDARTTAQRTARHQARRPVGP